MKKFLPAAIFLFCVITCPARAVGLEEGFAHPPEQTKPWCYWYWISDNISKEGITRDLEAMARVGIGEALIGNIFLEDVPTGKTKVLTPEWWELVAHAMREGGRTGVNIGMFNCPGWSQSGGPWIKPEQTMRYVVSSETRVSGPKKFAEKLPSPKEPFQDIAVLAFPVPQHDTDSPKSPRVTSTPPAPGVEKLADGDLATTATFPAGAGVGNSPFVVELEMNGPFTARSLQVHPSGTAFAADCELQAAGADGNFQTVKKFPCARSNMSPGVGFMPLGPVTVSFAPTTAQKFRIIFTNFQGPSPTAELAEIALSGAPRLESFVEKQLGKMHPTPLPMWDAYLWPTQAEPDAGVIPAADVQDLTANLAADGTLHWDVPPGEWIILRTGMTPTGMKNAPASPEGRGLEVDKMNRKLTQYHFDSFIGEALKRIPASDRKAFKNVVADSYEMGSQNWTDGFDGKFRQRYGYDPKPWLPVLTGRIVGSADASERFLWDLRRLVAERVATDYVGGLREECQSHDLGLWLENYGHWGFPSEFLKYGSESDRIGGEFWVTGTLGSIECRAASSCVNTYGKTPIVSAEAFTGGPAFQNSPAALKARGDWAFCEGINHFVLHVYIQQPWEDKVPGVNAWFGTEFNRHNTWFEQGKAWIDYLRRSCWLLQQGHRVADVAYFIGEDAPKMTGEQLPKLPEGRDFDFINSEVIEKNLTVKDGLLTLPHGTTYRVLVLPELETMRPEVLRKIRNLVQAGATVVGLPPSRSPSLENFPKCDEEIRKIAGEVWGDADKKQPGGHPFGKGRVVWGQSLEEVLAGSKPDFESSNKLRFTHRRDGDTDIYFVANPKAASLTTTAAFRVTGKAPELWWPDSGKIERPAVYEVADEVVRMPLAFGSEGSVFVVFREKATGNSVVSVARNGTEISDTSVKPEPAGANADQPDNFTFAAWVKPDADTTLPPEANRGVMDLKLPRNEAITPPHGDALGGADHAGSGLAVGRNGVCVLEHGAGYFAPVLVLPTTLADWTHVAVVYRDGQPGLYLNGSLVHTGLKSTHTVHSGVGQGNGAKFGGRLGGFVEFPRALSEAEVAALAKEMPCPAKDPGLAPLQLTRNDAGKITAQAAQPGNYELKFSDGRSQKLEVASVPAPLTIGGPWEVSFAPGRGAPEKTTFDQLADWTKNSGDGIKYFSGEATYRKTFELPAALVAPSTRLILDLGEVCDLATVRVNGQNLATLWHSPWQVDITSAVKTGANTLEIGVVNPWNNRLAGDAALPVEKRRTFLASQTVKPGAALQPAGLLGPVMLRPTEIIHLK